MIKIFTDFIFKPSLFKPTYRLHHFEQLISIAQTSKSKLIIFDKDDTLTTLGSFSITDISIKHTIQILKEKKILLKVLSNSIKQGDPTQIEQIQILKTSKKKPFNADEVLQVINDISLDNVLIVGDRLMTDIYLSNKIGCLSVLVPAVETSRVVKHGIAVVLLRKVQNMFLRLMMPKS